MPRKPVQAAAGLGSSTSRCSGAGARAPPRTHSSLHVEERKKPDSRERRKSSLRLGGPRWYTQTTYPGFRFGIKLFNCYKCSSVVALVIMSLRGARLPARTFARKVTTCSRFHSVRLEEGNLKKLRCLYAWVVECNKTIWFYQLGR